MKKLFYPVLFHKTEEGDFQISFPDLPKWLNEAAMANGSEFLSDFTRSSYFQNTGLICEL